MNPVKTIESNMITFTKANFHNVCRVCFCNNNPPVFNIFSSQFKEESIIDLFNICMPKQHIDISLPHNICKDCLNQLSQFKTFINQFQFADTLLTFVKEQLNNGSEQVKINNFSKQDDQVVVKNIKKSHSNSNLLSTSVFEQNNASGNTRKRVGILKTQKPTANILSNLNKTKSKSSDHIFPNIKSGPLLSLPSMKTCNVCEIQFFNQKIFEMHMRNSHPSQILKCSMCTPMKEFFDADELKRHKIASHEMIECTKCNSLVAAININKHHEKLHAANNSKGEEENQCKLHILKVETVNKLSNTKCDKCSNSFANDESLIEHLVSCKESKQETTTAPLTKPIKNTTMVGMLCKDKVYPSYTHFEQHCATQHKGTVCCNICRSNNLYSKEAFMLHKINVHEFVACYICNCAIKAENIQKHMKDCHKTK